ncbi:hypothetical protein [Aeromonas veronii]|uniref:hypothetical protein n=1 Tax=Aeromonas veronii TaxID=654 RepID=UPI0040559BD1
MSDSENHLFYGRSEELKHLFKAWTSASDGEPQWVTLVAESGTGKTRLLHEFYRCISDLEYRREKMPNDIQCVKEFDANDYWPNSLPIEGECLKINPEPERFGEITVRDCNQLPWLWWGLRGIPNGVRNRTESLSCLRDALPHLQPHISILVEQRLRHESNMDAALDIAKKAANLLTGGWIDPLITVCELIQNGKAPLQRLFGGYGVELREQQGKAQVELTQTLLDSLGRFLDEGIPVILVLDDCQWLDNNTVDFLARLIELRRVKKSKLLIITTSWAREWASSSDGDISDLFYNHFSGSKTIIPLGRIEPEFAGLYVKKMLADLIDTDVQLLLERADGNMRYLRELCLAVLKDKRSYLTRKGGSFCFTERAKEKLEQKEFDMDRLIEQRFLELSEDSQIALERCSYQGVRFDPDITCKIGDVLKLDNINTLEAIRKAESPGSMVLEVKQHKLWEFLQGPYWRLIHKRFSEVAESEQVISAYRHWISDNLNQDIDSRGMEQLVRAWANELLIINVDMQQQHDSGIPDQVATKNILQEVRLRFWLLRNAINHNEYTYAIKTLNRLKVLYSCNAYELLPELTLENAYYCLLVMNQYPFYGVTNACRDKNSSEPIFYILIQGVINKEVSAVVNNFEHYEMDHILHMYECSRALYLNRRYCGHMHDAQLLLGRLVIIEKKATSLLTNNNSFSLHERYVLDSLRYFEYLAQRAKDQKTWQHIFDQYAELNSFIEIFPSHTLKDIFWSLWQIEVLYFGYAARKYYPEDTNWGNTYHAYCRAANKIGDIIFSMSDPDAITEFCDKYSYIEQEAIVYAGTLISEFAVSHQYELATEFNDRLDVLVDAILDRQETGNSVSLDLISTCLDMRVATAIMQERSINKIENENDHYALSGIFGENVLEYTIKSREVGDKEYIASLKRVIDVGQRYLSKDFITVELIVVMTKAKMMLANDLSTAKDAFDEVLTYVSLIQDDLRALYGEQILLLPHLVWFYDRWLCGTSSEGEEMWLKLKMSYGTLSNQHFAEAVSRVRTMLK